LDALFVALGVEFPMARLNESHSFAERGRNGDSMDRLRVTRIACIVLVCVACTISSQAQTLSSLFGFDQTDGDNPLGALVQGANGNFYGTTSSDFGSGYGTAFEITPEGALTTLYTFCSLTNCADGAYPTSGLTLAKDGNFYGVTNDGGTENYGTFFKITPEGKLTTLYSFCSQANCADGTYPTAGLLQAANGNFYGVTAYGGATGFGTIFEITMAGTLTTLYNFCSQSNCADGGIPFGSLVQAKDGAFYGTTASGGAYGPYQYGTVYKLTASGKLITLYSFCSQTNCADGRYPTSGLVLAKNGNLYGTTAWGGPFLSLCNNGTGCGTLFEITPTGKLTTLYNFCSLTNCTDGDLPLAALIQARNGKLYGTTPYGGEYDYGTVFELTLVGGLTTVHSFDYSDGSQPEAPLLQAPSGSFYGTTLEGGSAGWGTVFRLSQE
jgi:uncharacterized repeat protein (TIGR03803 family)